MSKQVTFTMDLSDALMLMTTINLHIHEMESRGRIVSAADMLALNPAKRIIQYMCLAVVEQTTAEEIRAADKECDELYTL